MQKMFTIRVQNFLTGKFETDKNSKISIIYLSSMTIGILADTVIASQFLYKGENKDHAPCIQVFQNNGSKYFRNAFIKIKTTTSLVGHIQRETQQNRLESWHTYFN